MRLAAGAPSPNREVQTALVAMPSNVVNGSSTAAGDAIKVLRADIKPLVAGTGLHERSFDQLKLLACAPSCVASADRASPRRRRVACSMWPHPVAADPAVRARRRLPANPSRWVSIQMSQAVTTLS